ncbi:uncharacterized protein KD926_005218 [Aspergillus affinis]|uniref:uncharacterized protein n=1 Tax=Aspergillus affinis TaxID=1070780 RepID=UPI0022FE6F55|nr:uncharacterized protein KD926_005218 [Aspergillus affinis]KAI9042612.1 hypothetical protein KD926_005218 [Aspergillus affinis]
MARAAVIPKSSPPKRTTRTTAKRTTTASTTTTTTSKTTKPAPTKSATRTTTKGKAPTSATEARKRGVRTAAASSSPVDDSSDDGTDDELGDLDTKPKSSTTRTKAKSSAPTTTAAGRGRRAASTATPEMESDEDEDELAQTEVPKRRAGRPKARSAEPAEKPAPAPKTRGRPKGSGKANATAGKKSTQRKTRTRTQTSVEPEPEPEVEQAPKEIFITTNSSSMRSNILRGPAKKKKKVTFRDPDSEEDMSEPIPPTAGRRRAATPKKGGFAAKPVRSSPAATGRGRKPAAAKKGTSKPLSPKKATQVAKSISSYASSDGEEDELSAAKSPVRITVDSPTKHGSTNTGLSSPVKRINFAPASPQKKVDENGKPTAHLPMPMDFSESLFMSSPAHRPTPSPFNFTMKETPRRGGFTVREDMKPSNQQDSTPTKSSPLKASPRKAKLETPRRGNLNFLDESRPLGQPNFTPGHASPLKSSPKKGLFSISLPSKSAPPVSSTPLKSMSLLQSPAKRIASPFKSSLMKKSPLAEEDELDDEDPEDSYSPTQSPPKPVNFDDMDDDMETEDDEHVNAAAFEDPEESFPAENQMQSQPETENYAEAEASEASDNEPEEQSQEYTFDHIDDQYSAIPDVQEDPMDPTELQAQETASEHDFEEDNVDLEAVDDNAEDDLEDVESHSNSHPGDIRADFKYHEEKRESLANGTIEDVDDEADLVEEKVHDTEEDKDDVSELDHGETERLAEPEQTQEDPVENTPEHSITREESTSTGRCSLIEGLEDVFVDAPLPIGQMNEEPDSLSGDDMLEAGGEEADMAEPNDEYDEELYDVGDEYAFDDDEETIVAFEMTGQQQMFYAPDIAHEQPQDTAPRQVQDQPPRSPVESMEQQITQAPVDENENDLQESAPREIENRPSPPSLRNVEGYREESKDETDSNADDLSDSEPGAEGSMHASKNASPQVPPQPEHQSPAPATEAPRSNRPRFTLLADQLSGWRASSPQKPEPKRSKRRGVFSLGGGLRRSSGVPRASRLSGHVSYPEITAREDNITPESSHQENNVEDRDIASQTDMMMHESDAIQANGQEVQRSIEQPKFEIFSDPEPEAVHTEAANETSSSEPLLASSNEEFSTKPGSPAQEASFEYDDDKENDDVPLAGPVTPIKNRNNQLQTVHTVSKVPLKGEGQISPLKASRKRGLSMGTSPTRSSTRIRKSLGPLEPALLRPSPKLPRLQQDTIPKLQPNMSRRRSSMAQQPRSAAKPSRTSSPAKSPRKSISAANLALQGAVVFVDVHTTEGEDASGIFIELLQQMGARCVKTWSWNPRASVSPDEDAQTKEIRVGITHVVYKDGGVRTLEKVRHARGLVKCVGVGWVLDCEREGKWLDEAHYAVDSSIIPRGGAKRRKSMEPRALSNVNGTLVTSAATANSRKSGADWNTVEEFKRHTPTPPPEEPSTPTNNRQNDADINERYFQTPKTPGYGFNIDNIGMSPATPYYLSQRNKLVQQTCPPKQLQQGLFERAGPAEQPSQKLRTKLEAARRKSLAYKPRVGSPLIE